MIQFFKEVFNHFLDSNTFQKGAALGYYAVFSLLPMIIIITSLLGIFFGEKAVSGEIYDQLKDVLGNEASIQLQNLIKNQHTNYNSSLTAIIGFATLALSAAGMFSQVHSSFNSIWNIKAKPKSSILKYLKQHFVSFLILLLLFLIILISTSASSFLLKNAENLKSGVDLFYIYEHIISFFVLAFIFSIMFTFLSDAKVNFKASLAAGAFTSLFFLFGKMGIAYLISSSHISTTFGSASLLALLMIWVYYTSQIIFLGASFLKVISEKLGHPIRPGENAVEVENRELKG